MDLKKKKTNGRGGEGEFYSQFGFLPLSKGIALMNIRFLLVNVYICNLCMNSICFYKGGI
jgi:hypothetical protein